VRAFTASVTGTAAQVTIQKGSILAPNTVIIQNPTGSGQTLYVGGDSGVTTHMHHLTGPEWAQRSGVENVVPFPVPALFIMSLAAAGRAVV
jgi:hypothetical protein